MNKRKILNDPVYGFITIPYEVVFDLISHPFFQRLRRIKQLGLTHYVYPGALHTRFNHAIGAMHLMVLAIEVLRSKGYEITDDEAKGAVIAILLHDIGHGPYSHTLESTLIAGNSHEFISIRMMYLLNDEMGGQLETAIEIFEGSYHKKFLHQLVSSQLDVDRLDYLNRDSFFTGVSEGVIGYDRIIKMLAVQNDQLVVEAKGIYSIEKFIISRRLMYWQVYLHKTVLCAEEMLVKTLSRAQFLKRNGHELRASTSLNYFLENDIVEGDFLKDDDTLGHFARLDDFDVFIALKHWCDHPDWVLSFLCNGIVNRRLFQTELENEPPTVERVNGLRKQAMKKYGIDEEAAAFLVFTGSTSNSAYNPEAPSINLLYRNGNVRDITNASDQLNLAVLSKPVVKYYLCYPKGM